MILLTYTAHVPESRAKSRVHAVLRRDYEVLLWTGVRHLERRTVEASLRNIAMERDQASFASRRELDGLTRRMCTRAPRAGATTKASVVRGS